MNRTWTEIMQRFQTIELPQDVDMVVAIANGGIVPAAIINQRLQKAIYLLKLNLRDDNHQPRYDRPQLLSPIDFEFSGRRILLVDDRIKTGATIRMARELLKEAADIRTFAVNGSADYALFDEDCFPMPWRIHNTNN